MIIVLKNNSQEKQVEELLNWLDQFHVSTNLVEGVHSNVIGLIGDTTQIDIEAVQAKECVEKVQRVQEPYKNANRKFHPDNTVIDVAGRKIGGGKLQVIAGPCSVETEEQIITTAIAVKEAGATMLRGGAFKPRTSPYSFQGLGKEGIDLLIQARKITGLPIVTEIMDLSDLDCFADVDVVQVGARNMQNFTLLKALGRSDKPVLLKRGLSSTLQELLMSAEYIMSEGNQNVILCERGIRTFEPATRNTLDLSAVPLLQQKTHLPITIDPSHATGIASLVEPMALCAVTAGCDALEIEVHNDPKNAWSDGAQSLTPAQFAETMKKVKALSEFMGKSMDGGDIGDLEYENFNAASAKVTIKGCSVHTGYAKGKMVNASRLACEFNAHIPETDIPETTEGYQGFYHLLGIESHCEQAKLSYIIRDHDRRKFEDRKDFMENIAKEMNEKYGDGTVKVDIKDQYYNMKEKIDPKMYVIDIVLKAMQESGVTPKVEPIRGGTDGAQLSFRGLPCPNIFAGGVNFHGPYEFVSIQVMNKAVDVIVKICQIAGTFND